MSDSSISAPGATFTVAAVPLELVTVTLAVLFAAGLNSRALVEAKP